MPGFRASITGALGFSPTAQPTSLFQEHFGSRMRDNTEERSSAHLWTTFERRLLSKRQKAIPFGGEMNKLLRAEEHATQEMDEFLADIRTRGLDVLEGEPDLAYSALKQRLVGKPEEIDVNLVQVAADPANDPVRIYLREMGATPLLTREGEVGL